MSKVARSNSFEITFSLYNDDTRSHRLFCTDNVINDDNDYAQVTRDVLFKYTRDSINSINGIESLACIYDISIAINYDIFHFLSIM